MLIWSLDLVQITKTVTIASVNCNEEFLVQYRHEEMKRKGSQIFISSATVAKRYKNIILKSVFSVFNCITECRHEIKILAFYIFIPVLPILSHTNLLFQVFMYTNLLLSSFKNSLL